MQTEPILTETIASIQDILGAHLDRITVERAVVGLFFTGVKLDTGVTGACATPLRSIPDARAPLWASCAVGWPVNKLGVAYVGRCRQPCCPVGTSAISSRHGHRADR